MGRNSKPRQRLNEYGYAGAYESTLNEKDFILDFKVDAGFAYGFSEITLLNYVAESYRSSALELLRKVNKITDYDKSKMSSKTPERLSHGYIPAMFCFRHYLELKLKSIYMTIKREQFNSGSHNLTELFGEIEKEINMLCIDSVGIENAVKYVESLESKNPYHFRYYIDKDFKLTTQIAISYKTIFDELNKMITDFAKCCYEIEKTIACTMLKLIKQKGDVWKPEIHGEMTIDVISKAIN